MSIVKVVGEIATFRLSCADEPALCAAFAVPPSTKPTFGVLAGDAQNTLLPYRGEWNSDALEWLAETRARRRTRSRLRTPTTCCATRLLEERPPPRRPRHRGARGRVPGGVAAERSRPLVLPPAVPAAAGGRADRAADGRGGARRAELPNWRDAGDLRARGAAAGARRARSLQCVPPRQRHRPGTREAPARTSVRVARRAMVLASTDWTVHFRHMRKAGGTAVRNFLRANSSCGNMLDYEWHPTVFPAHEGGSERFSSGITHFRDPIARIVSAYVFEGMAPGCWEDAWNASGTSSCVPRYQQSGVATFRAYLDDGRADAEGALLDQGMRCAGSSDGTVTAPEAPAAASDGGTSPTTTSRPCCTAGRTTAATSSPSLSAVPRRRGAPGDRRRLPVLVLFDGGGGAPRMSAACADLERRCDVDTSSQPWPWPMQRWSPDGHEHVLGTDPTDAEVERLRRLRRRRYAAPQPCHHAAALRGHASECMEFGAQLYDALPDVIAELEGGEPLRYPYSLRAAARPVPRGEAVGAGAVAAIGTASRDAIQGSGHQTR